jgi:hypothetical protein
VAGGAAVTKNASGGYTVAATNGSQSLTAAQAAALIAQLGSTANSVYKSTQTPYTIPGTNLVYNPATGQLLNAGTGGAIGGTGTGTNLLAGISTQTLLIGGGLLVLVLFMGKK